MKVTIDNASINALITRTELTQKYQFLNYTITTKGCCSSPAQTHPDYERIKTAIAAMGTDEKTAFKADLCKDPNCEVVVFHKEGNEVKLLTF